MSRLQQGVLHRSVSTLLIRINGETVNLHCILLLHDKLSLSFIVHSEVRGHVDQALVEQHYITLIVPQLPLCLMCEMDKVKL